MVNDYSQKRGKNTLKYGKHTIALIFLEFKSLCENCVVMRFKMSDDGTQ